MFYDRQVKYLDDLINGERMRNAGFIKLEARGNICNINISLSCPDIQASALLKVYAVNRNREYELCGINLMQGKGTKQLLGLEPDNIAKTGLTYSELEAIKIPVTSERVICGMLKDLGGQDEESIELRAAAEDMPEEMPEEVPEENAEEETRKSESLEGNSEMSLQDSKWKQLWAIYPHVSPFRDEREFLSVAPGDFVILHEKYFRLVNNSFLLHGYYNYKHLILKRMEYQGKAHYYIGVPGNFYDREKQVAVMFGFESFESLREPAEAGDYGYYMMSVEL